MQRSQQLLRGMRWQLALPFVGLLLGGRALEFAKASLLSSMPARRVERLWCTSRCRCAVALPHTLRTSSETPCNRGCARHQARSLGTSVTAPLLPQKSKYKYTNQ